MIVDCHSCGATYNISDEKIRGRRVRVRCKSCNESIIVDGANVEAEDATRVYAPTFDPAAYGDGENRDEATRVMTPSGVDFPIPEPGEWTVNVSDSEQRTMGLREMVTAYQNGTLTADAFVWRDGMDDWLPLLEVPQIRTMLQASAPPTEEATQVLKPSQLRPSMSRAAEATPAAPVAYSAPSAPPRGRVAAPPPTSVEYVPGRSAPPPARPGPAAARMRERAGRPSADLFGGADHAGGEEELLRSSSMPLEQYETKPTGVRNESSVLFSLDALKASRSAPSSAPPRAVPSAPTAADILGMTSGGALPGMGMQPAQTALLSAPQVDAPPASVPTLPPRARMNTLPPATRRKSRLPFAAALVVAALAAAAGAFFFVRREARQRAAEEAATAAASATATTTETTPPPLLVPEPAATASTAPAEPAAPAPAETVVPAPPTPAAPAPAPAPQAIAPASRPGPAPKGPAPKAAQEPAPESPGGLEAAIRPPGEPQPTPAPGTDKGQKVVLAEEEGAEAPPEAEPERPPFDTGAAKSALEAAAGSAGACKKPDAPTGRGKVQVTFSPKTGRATSANVIEGPFGGTPVGGCIAKLFRAAKVPPFSGDPVTVAKGFSVE